MSTPSYLTKYALCFLDDGHGMSPESLEEAICYGKSIKRSQHKIGQFGVGLKSASMRLASNMILFTKCVTERNETINSILLLSDTFNSDIDVREPLVAMPSFKQDCLTPYFTSQNAREVFADEMQLIFKYSPFKTLEDLKLQFEKITTRTGTLIICYDLKLNNSTQGELFKIDTDKHDILVNDYSCSFEDTLKFELESLKAFMSMLYCKPIMKIYILGKKVKTKYMIYELALTRKASHELKTLDKLKTKEFKLAEHQLKIAQDEVKDIENLLKYLKF